ncbi:MAG: helix-turn-helix transcriptional regulator [Ruminococcus sp.]|nr:helix-turn-helix transcriptional regulator [Ruminococcus sp.]
MESVGKQISGIRNKRGYTQKELAELAGISVQFLSDIENDKKSMTIKTLKNLAYCLGVTTDYIIYGKSNSAAIQPTLDALSDKEKKQAEKLLSIFIEIIRDKHSK